MVPGIFHNGFPASYTGTSPSGIVAPPTFRSARPPPSPFILTIAHGPRRFACVHAKGRAAFRLRALDSRKPRASGVAGADVDPGDLHLHLHLAVGRPRPSGSDCNFGLLRPHSSLPTKTVLHRH